MYSQNRKPSEIIALQKGVIGEQESIIAILKGALAAADIPAPSDQPACLRGLTDQENALIGALFRSYPRPIDKYELLELLPGYDHVAERQIQVVAVKVHHLRKKLGADAIENLRCSGYRLGAGLHQALRDQRSDPRAPGKRPAAPYLRLVV